MDTQINYTQLQKGDILNYNDTDTSDGDSSYVILFEKVDSSTSYYVCLRKSAQFVLTCYEEKYSIEVVSVINYEANYFCNTALGFIGKKTLALRIKHLRRARH